MRNTRWLNIIPLLMLLTLIPVARYYPGIERWGYGGVLLTQVSIIIYGCVNIQSGYFMEVLCRAKTSEKVISLSFDDGPDAKYTADILDTLNEHNVQATFFCIGKNIAGNEFLLGRINDEGHIIGNHSHTHGFWFDLHSAKAMLADMQKMDEAVVKATGLRPLLFRPPYGVTNPAVRRAVKRGKYTPIGWSIRPLDTVAKDRNKLISGITARLEPGGIILLHDTMAITAEILPELIITIKESGYTIVRLDKMLNVRTYA